MSKKNKIWSPEAKLAILKEQMVEGRSVSEVCESHQLAPSVFYRWRDELFSNGQNCFNRKGKHDQSKQENRRIKQLEVTVAKQQNKLMQKNEVIAELLEEHTKVKKSLGEL